MKNFLYFLFLFILNVYPNIIHSQCDKDGSAFINEVNIGREGRNNEYIELVVTGDPENPLDHINLEGYIIDDNNSAATGSTRGHIRLGNCFAQVPPGTVILIYNHNEPPKGIDPTSQSINGTPNFYGAYVLPFSDDCIIKYSACPKPGVTDLYNCNSIANSPKHLWEKFIGLDNFGDVIQVRKPNHNLVHAITWGGVQYEYNGDPKVVDLGVDFVVSNHTCGLYKNTNWFELNNFKIYLNSSNSPYIPNSSDNHILIDNIKNGVGSNPLIGIDCQVNNGDNGSTNGQVTINILDGEGPYTIELSDGQFVNTSETSVVFNSLSCGSYSVNVQDQFGCFEECHFVIEESRVLDYYVCDENCIDVLVTPLCDTNSEDYCYYWSPTDFFENHLNESQEFCPTDLGTYDLMISNNDGMIIGHYSIVIGSGSGNSCDDGNYCTINDTYDENCNCIGTNIPNCYPCDTGASCSDGDPCTTNDTIDENCECIGEPIANCGPCVEGSPCDDNDVCTTNDQIDNDCNCYGTPIVDCLLCEEDSPCDDNDPCTENDVFNEDCECEGIQIEDCIPCQEGSPCDDNNTCTIDESFDDSCNCQGTEIILGLACDDNDPCTVNDAFNNECDCVGEDPVSLVININTIDPCVNGLRELSIDPVYEEYTWHIDDVYVSDEPTMETYLTGEVRLGVSTSDGCSYYETVEILDYNESNIEIIASDEFICNPKSPVRLEVSPFYDSPEWFDENMVSLGNQSQLDITLPGEYRVVATDQNGCEVFGLKEIRSEIFDLKIEPENPIFCEEPVQLRVNVQGENYQVQWFELGAVMPFATGEMTQVFGPGIYIARIQNTEIPNCIEQLQVKVIDPNSNEHIKEKLIDNGFICSPINISGPAFNGSGDDPENSSTCSAQTFQNHLTQDYFIQFSDGSEKKVSDYVNEKLQASCSCIDGTAGLLMNDFCASPDFDLEFFLDFENNYESPTQVFLMLGGGENGGDCLWIKSNLQFSNNYHKNPLKKEFQSLMKNLACAYQEKDSDGNWIDYSLSEIVIRDEAITHWYSGPVELFTKINAYYGIWEPIPTSPPIAGFVVNNYIPEMALNFAEMDSEVISVTDESIPVGNIGILMNGEYLQIRIPYKGNGCDEVSLTITYPNEPEYSNLFEQLIVEPFDLILEAVENENLNVLERVPSCLVTKILTINICNVINELKNNSQADAAIINLIDAHTKEQAENLISCLESDPEDSENSIIDDLFESFGYFNKSRFLANCTKLYYVAERQKNPGYNHLSLFRLEEIISFDYKTATVLGTEIFSDFDDEATTLTLKYRAISPGMYIDDEFEVGNFKHFDGYLVYLDGSFNRLPQTKNGIKQWAFVPGVYFEYAIRGEYFDEISRLTLNGVFTLIPGAQLKYAKNLSTLQKSFATAEITVNVADIFLSNESLCDEIGIYDFCEKWKKAKYAADLILVTGAFLPSQNAKILSLRDSYNNLSTSKQNAFKKKIDDLHGIGKGDELVELIQSVTKTRDEFAEKYPLLELNHPKILDDIVTQNPFSYVLLLDDINNELITSFSLNKRKQFFEDIINTSGTGLPRSLGNNLEKLTPPIISAWDKMLNANSSLSLRTNAGALEALSLPKFSRPQNPGDYLSANYLFNHLSNFNAGVVRFSSSAPTGVIGPPGGTFVIPKSLADNLINQSGGNVSILEDLLGLNSGTLGASPFRIDISNPIGTRMPNGNELGANSNWIPGGKTSGGILEATVDPIQPGNYIVNPVF